jgi:hypothetical protein
MAEVLLQYYKYVADKVGASGKIKLAIETKIPSTKAAMVPDSAANIALFDAAVAKITGAPAPKIK